MRNIGSLKNENEALTFCDYLYGREIRCEAEQASDGTWNIWVYEEGQVGEGAEEFDKFIAAPDDPQYRAHKGLATKRREEEERQAEEAQAKIVDMRLKLGSRANMGAGAVTIGLIMVSVVVYLSQYIPGTKGLYGLFLISNVPGSGLLSPEVLQGQVWRLFTPIFLHLSLMHILFNLMWLHALGGGIESHDGSRRLGLMVLFMALSSNLLQYWMAGGNFGGMSGVVYGLFGYTIIRMKYDPTVPYELDRFNTVLMIGWFFLCWTGWMGPIANWAHTGGFLLGLAWGAWDSRLWRKTR
ncbi:hypothetical protein CVU37_02080 [candidate division BRC1 bacterium HGW-BRC1-1]|jgi:GlpG protein|nr:MAG: hypothetical protein CVU37_02080 [candidate division BRC1 bacterium HGW-BRC1-1]